MTCRPTRQRRGRPHVVPISRVHSAWRGQAGRPHGMVPAQLDPAFARQAALLANTRRSAGVQRISSTAGTGAARRPAGSPCSHRVRHPPSAGPRRQPMHPTKRRPCRVHRATLARARARSATAPLLVGKNLERRAHLAGLDPRHVRPSRRAGGAAEGSRQRRNRLSTLLQDPLGVRGLTETVSDPVSRQRSSPSQCRDDASLLPCRRSSSDA